jgi:hypothetical protein
VFEDEKNNHCPGDCPAVEPGLPAPQHQSGGCFASQPGRSCDSFFRALNQSNSERGDVCSKIKDVALEYNQINRSIIIMKNLNENKYARLSLISVTLTMMIISAHHNTFNLTLSRRKI